MYSRVPICLYDYLNYRSCIQDKSHQGLKSEHVYDNNYQLHHFITERETFKKGEPGIPLTVLMVLIE